MSGYLIGPSGIAPAGSTLDAATTAWISAVVGAGGTVSGTQTTRVNALLSGLRSDGLLSKGDALWLWGGESVLQQATIDVINLRVGTQVASIPLTAGGFTGNGSTMAFDTGIVLSGGGLNFSQDSASMLGYQVTSANDGVGLVGATLTNNASLVVFPASNVFRIHANCSLAQDFTCSNATGQFSFSRTASNATVAMVNGSVLGTDTTASIAGLSTNNTYGVALNAGGPSIAAPNNGQMSAMWIGGGLTNTQMGNLQSRINTYMTAWGINTY